MFQPILYSVNIVSGQYCVVVFDQFNVFKIKDFQSFYIFQLFCAKDLKCSGQYCVAAKILKIAECCINCCIDGHWYGYVLANIVSVQYCVVDFKDLFLIWLILCGSKKIGECKILHQLLHRWALIWICSCQYCICSILCCWF